MRTTLPKTSIKTEKSEKGATRGRQPGVQHRESLRTSSLLLSGARSDDPVAWKRYLCSSFEVEIIMHYLPAVLYCTSLMVSETLSANNHRKKGLEREEKEKWWQIFNTSALAAQLAMMQSLQPNTPWCSVFIPQFHSSWHADNTLAWPHSGCPACTFDEMKKGKNHFYKIFSVGISSMSWDQMLTGNPLKLPDSSKKR